MNFVQSENVDNKERARQQLREARNEMLANAKERAMQAEQKVHQDPKKESNGTKLERRERENKKCKKRKDKKKKSKKSKKKRHKKPQSDNSSSIDSSESDTNDNYEEHCNKNEFRKSKKKSHRRSKSPKITEECTLERDTWMTDTLLLKTYSKERVEKKANEKEAFETYDPCRNIRELNPYWKATGTGLPTTFQKPKNDTDEDEGGTSSSKGICNKKNDVTSQSWRKKDTGKDNKFLSRNRSNTSSSDTSAVISERLSNSDDKEGIKKQYEVSAINDVLTDQQMNELGAKLIKAEIMGNMILAEELKNKLENARKSRFELKKRKNIDLNQLNGYEKRPIPSQHILLTYTDAAGCSKPLPRANCSHPRDLDGNHQKSRKRPRIETHDQGQRIRYFADDDKYDIKQMFEKEKYTSAADNNMEFANIVGKHNSLRDDVEDIFTEKASQYDQQKADKKLIHQCIRDHQKLEKVLDNCDKCFDSTRMQKELLVTVGEKVYLALPWHVGLQTGHCVIASNQHVACATQLDEDAWSEVQEFRKALTRMFERQHKDVVFYEIANRLHRKPHMTIHCVPVHQKEGEMAPFYFKKAIEESEREWSVNKQLITLRERSFRKCIPKGLPYFWVNFGMDTGFAHVIEDEDRFPANFAQEIIGGLLQMESSKWRKLHKEQNVKQKVQMFTNCWEKYDFTR
ncbi:CWF19-like protein 2 homolog [Glossina fuscipes]|uniref:CWF19-like protein 2 homolog n=1 Tax=Glossina fuscipes TaxID=7396 RepID=A0A8U0WL70_9MUSC|nr:CWF19-like protein 2 homolog [Glossina fuscipes]KAI9589006.1 hypothetical protein GQX74_007175 [Glossina fuscipes]